MPLATIGPGIERLTGAFVLQSDPLTGCLRLAVFQPPIGIGDRNAVIHIGGRLPRRRRHGQDGLSHAPCSDAYRGWPCSCASWPCASSSSLTWGATLSSGHRPSYLLAHAWRAGRTDGFGGCDLGQSVRIHRSGLGTPRMDGFGCCQLVRCVRNHRMSLRSGVGGGRARQALVHASRSSADQVLITRSMSTPVAAARSQPCGCHSSWPVAWASESIEK